MLTLYLALICGDKRAINELATSLFSEKVGHCFYPNWKWIKAFEQYIINCQIIPAFGRACGVICFDGKTYEWGY